MNDRIEVVKALLAAGADPNMVCRQTLSALNVAAINDRLEITKLLIAAGAKIRGTQAIQFAKEFNHPELAKYLEAQEAEADKQRK